MVYLLHFNEPYITETGRKVQHYIGSTTLALSERLKRHNSDNGAKLLKALNARGIGFTVARTWDQEGIKFEYQLKKQRNHKRFCPICNGKEEGHEHT